MALVSSSSSSITSNSMTVTISHSGNAVDNYKLFKDGSLYASNSFAQTTSHSTSILVSGLSPSTEYTISVYYYRGTTQIDSDLKKFTTKAPPVPDALSNLVVEASGYAPSTSVSASWNASTGASGYKWETNASTSDGIKNGSVTTTGKSITVTSPVGGYQFTVTPYNSSGDGTGLTKSFAVVNPPLPSALTGLEISVSGTAPNASVTAIWNSSSGATQYNWSTTATTSDGIKSGHVTSTSKSITVTIAGTFNITVYPNNISGNGTPSSKAFDVSRPRPQNFNWTYSGRSLTPPFAPIQVNPNDPTKDPTKGFYVSASEWNILIARVLLFREYIGLPTFWYNSAVAGDQPMASQFNQVRNAIEAMNSSGLPSTKNTGAPITAADLNALRSCLNAIP